MNCIFDKYAWIEYLKGSDKGKKVESLIRKGNRIITLECALAELRTYCIMNGVSFDCALFQIKDCSIILPVTSDIWIEAAAIKCEMRKNRPHFGLIDALLLAKQQDLDSHIVTGDPHFKGLKNVILI
jgi:predicted nucleic acid-binding protein